jgi:hypothetical protein
VDWFPFKKTDKYGIVKYLLKELDALLVTVDHGAIKWAEKLGICRLLPNKFKDHLESFHDVRAEFKNRWIKKDSFKSLPCYHWTTKGSVQ